MTRRGTFKVTGQTTIDPLQGKFHIDTEHLDLAWLEPLINTALGSSKLNAKITNAVLAMDGDANVQLSNKSHLQVVRPILNAQTIAEATTRVDFSLNYL